MRLCDVMACFRQKRVFLQRVNCETEVIKCTKYIIAVRYTHRPHHVRVQRLHVAAHIPR
jgi:hypothetical protein